MSESQYKPKGTSTRFKRDDGPPGYDLRGFSTDEFNQKYREWLRRRGLHEEADYIDRKSAQQLAKYNKRKSK
tara:strand:- start:7 stop:222 length:216 start_codon:yes stop_codon:yes gene_type:complete